jgi:hypothetical protein
MLKPQTLFQNRLQPPEVLDATNEGSEAWFSKTDKNSRLGGIEIDCTILLI